MADVALIRKLLNLAHETGAPEEISGEFGEKEFATACGWKVWIFYDAGELDYVDHFISPAGECFDLWGERLDPRINDGDEMRFATLQNWRGLEDTARLLESLEEPKTTAPLSRRGAA